MINGTFLITAYIVCQAVDWILQTQYQARYKSDFGPDADVHKSMSALLTHSTIYAFLSVIILVMLQVLKGPVQIVVVYVVLLFTHVLIDNRIPVKWILQKKGMSEEDLKDPHLWFMHVGIDHRLHEIVLLILACIIK